MIAPDILLTAAHCTESFQEVQIGRHNRSDNTEVYQSLIVEEVVNHPMYFRNRFLDPDPHDFAIVKLYGHVDTQQFTFIKLNGDSNIPEPNQQLQVFGWGSINPKDFREQSDVLRETDAYYIPNDECRTIQGEYRGFEINFSQIVVDVTLCAMDFEGMTDSCRGDSGGGLIVRGETPENDVLVGLVSAGYGCAHETLPALYARVSEVYEWIREHVCELSEYPPEYLECKEKPRISDHDDDVDQTVSDVPIPFDCEDILVGRDADTALSSPSPLQFGGNIPCTTTETMLVTLMLTLGLDTRPEERGWILRTRTPSGAWVTETERPIFSYAGFASMSTVRETVFLANNREYEITLLDAYGDGHEQSLSSAAVQSVLRLMDQDSYSEIVNVEEFNVENSNGYRLSSPFVLGTLPTLAPTISPAPTMTMTPTSSPTSIRPFITVNITFDEYPQNVGFRLESVLKNTQNETELLHVVYPGNFAAELQGTYVLVEVPLFPPNPEPQSYLFTMTSNEGNGLGSEGEYQVWLGSVNSGMLLFDGDIFYYEESTRFEIEPSMLPPTAAPGMSLGFGRLEGDPLASTGTMTSMVLSLVLGVFLMHFSL
jgi:hypothetical protein